MIRQSGFSQFLGTCWEARHKTLCGIAGVAVMALLFAGPVLQTDVQAQSSGELPTIKFSRSSFHVNEGSSVELTVLKDGEGAASVNYKFTDEGVHSDTATANEDYVDAPGTLDFADEETTKTITVNAQADSEVEEAETVQIHLSLPDTAGVVGSDAKLVIPFKAAIVILDCNTPDAASC